MKDDALGRRGVDGDGCSPKQQTQGGFDVGSSMIDVGSSMVDVGLSMVKSCRRF